MKVVTLAIVVGFCFGFALALIVLLAFGFASAILDAWEELLTSIDYHKLYKEERNAKNLVYNGKFGELRPKKPEKPAQSVADVADVADDGNT